LNFIGGLLIFLLDCGNWESPACRNQPQLCLFFLLFRNGVEMTGQEIAAGIVVDILADVPVAERLNCPGYSQHNQGAKSNL
jgi:hypothetical protein